MLAHARFSIDIAVYSCMFSCIYVLQTIVEFTAIVVYSTCLNKRSQANARVATSKHCATMYVKCNVVHRLDCLGNTYQQEPDTCRLDLTA